MRMRNSEAGYGVISRINHWLTAVLMITVFLLGENMEELEEGSSAASDLFNLHSSLGLLVLALVILRLAWKPLGGSVPAVSTSTWQDTLAKAVRLVLWGSLIGMPLSGWAMVNGEGHLVTFFNMLDLPQLVASGSIIGEAAEEIHEILPNLFLGALSLHIVGALKHHWVDHDCTLHRMISGKDCQGSRARYS